MKLYYILYRTQECGELECFTSKADAQKRITYLQRENKKHWKCIQKGKYDKEGSERTCQCYSTDDVNDTVFEVEFPISGLGLKLAMEHGAYMVPK